jgi:hypothetical protein
MGTTLLSTQSDSEDAVNNAERSAVDQCQAVMSFRCSNAYCCQVARILLYASRPKHNRLRAVDMERRIFGNQMP